VSIGAAVTEAAWRIEEASPAYRERLSVQVPAPLSYARPPMLTRRPLFSLI